MTIKSFLVTLATLSAVSTSPVPQWDETNIPSIAGGVPAQAGDFPFIVSSQEDGFTTAVVLLDSTTVLTAAHWADGRTTTDLTVRAGSLNRDSGGVISAVTQLVIHPSYDRSIINNDVAILKLRTPIPESSTIKYATLAPEGSDPANNSVATSAGWGYIQSATESSTNLRKFSVSIIGRAECKALYLKDSPPKAVTDNMVCAGLDADCKDSCQGDGGGPIVKATSGTLIGAVSWGTGCALASFPGVYARVGSLRGFIDQYI